MPAGKPKLTTTATLGRTDPTTTVGVVRTVVELVPHTDRDLVLARLNRPVTTVTPVALASTGATAGESLIFTGYGRPQDEWAPLKLHTGTLSADSSDAATAPVTGQDDAAVCAGDAGGPEVRVTGGKATLVAVNSPSWHSGCFGTDASKVGATRVTDFDCDGVEDTAVGDPLASVNGLSEAGMVKVVCGGGRDALTLHQDLDYVPGGAEAGDRFGETLAVVDYDEDGCSDLVVGAPHEDIGAVAATSNLALGSTRARAADSDDDYPFSLPDTDRSKVVQAWMLGGQAVRAAAETALTGADTDVQTFLTTGLATFTAVDNRTALVTALAGAGKGTWREAAAALDAGDTAIADFLTTGYKAAVVEDMQAATSTVMSTGGKALLCAGDTTLDTDTQAALETFLETGQYNAREEDTRVEVSSLMLSGGPEVQKYATRDRRPLHRSRLRVHEQ